MEVSEYAERGSEPPDPCRGIVRTRGRVLAALVIAAVAGALVSSARQWGRSTISPPALFEGGIDVEGLPDLGIHFAGDYPPVKPGLYPWENIVEPHRDTTISVATSARRGVGTALEPSRAVRYEWTIDRIADGSLADAGERVLDPGSGGEGEVVTFVFGRPTGKYLVRVYEVDVVTGGVVRWALSTAVCKYVRREIHTLSDQDRNGYLKALRTFHTTDQAEGEKLYGAGYVGYQRLTEMHIANVSSMGCSPYHGGDSFITAHAVFSLILEQSLQAIDPRVSQPYWDVTVEGRMDNDWHQSDLFSDKWFGSYSDHEGGKGDDYVVTGGVLDRLPNVLLREGGVEEEHNAYGVVTNAYNNNPNRYIQRSRFMCDLPFSGLLDTCVELQWALDSTSVDELATALHQGIHMPLHMGMGGAWECSTSTRDILDPAGGAPWQGDPAVHILLERTMVVTVGFWMRMQLSGTMECPSSCSPTTPFEDCKCFCPAVKGMGGVDPYSSMSYLDLRQLLADGSAWLILSGYPKTMEFMSPDEETGSYKWDTGYQELDEMVTRWTVRMACNLPAMGQFTSPYGAYNDPATGPLHALYDVLWQRKRLGLLRGDTVFDETWIGDGLCAGHQWDSVLPFSNLFKGDVDRRGYSNEELYARLDPARLDLPYVYDDMSFQACQTSVST